MSLKQVDPPGAPVSGAAAALDEAAAAVSGAAAPAAVAHPGRTAAWLAKQVEVGLADAGLTLPQYRVLCFLDSGPSGSSALARHLAVRPPSVTAVVDGLVARGLLARVNDEGDRRCVSLHMTDGGRQLLADADHSVEARLASLAGLLPAAEADRAVRDLSLWQRALVAYRQERERERELEHGGRR